MADQKNLDVAYMKCAAAIAELSRARRKKVGVILVAPNGGIIAEGFNGTLSGFDNNCEEEVIDCIHRWEYDIQLQKHACYICREEISNQKLSFDLHGSLPNVKTSLKTKEECVHAESNAIIKVARSNNSSRGATLYCTLTPCFECAKLIIQAGIARVVYGEEYPYATHTGPARKLGLELLAKAGIIVSQLI